MTGHPRTEEHYDDRLQLHYAFPSRNGDVDVALLVSDAAGDALDFLDRQDGRD
jgi:hypothetical protein